MKSPTYSICHIFNSEKSVDKSGFVDKSGVTNRRMDCSFFEMAIKVKDDKRKNMTACRVCTVLNPTSDFGSGSCSMVSVSFRNPSGFQGMIFLGYFYYLSVAVF